MKLEPKNDDTRDEVNQDHRAAAMALYLRLATCLTVGGPRRHGGAGARTTTTAYVAAAVSARAAAARSPYEVLRVGEAAPAAEVRAAYRAMAKRAHPDAGGGGNGEAFLELRRAYETLSDPAARARYDASVVAGRLRLARERTGGRSGPAPAARRTWETDQCW
ncbi:hypothetical protein SETIT_2G247000v2 [Setaria italica]|uniref:J domain-containing protein n=1 Tax=Setaria italica TaxID=4555 RepID=A0A368Q285_SETIT|nr:hypothetical protein SETIT_2G247000v2 [Setaria italica]